MQSYCESLTQYRRLATREVRIGHLLLGNFHPIRVQTMTTTDTMDTLGTVEQSIRCIEAGAELVRITAPSKKEAENLAVIKGELHRRGYTAPLVADIHFTPNAAEIAARIVEKVRINPGNYIDKKKFELIEYTDADYAEELDRIQARFTPLIHICKEYGTAMRIGTNHGSLSDRIMSRYGDTPVGMVESAMEFLRIARDESYHNIVLSMKASNPQVMVQAYRLLVKTMQDEFGECYPLHLGVTEAGDGEDGRIKSAVGIGTLLEDGLGDTVRVSLTEDPELEIPVCRALIKKYKAPPPPKGGVADAQPKLIGDTSQTIGLLKSGPIQYSRTLPLEGQGEAVIPPLGGGWAPFNYRRRSSFSVNNIGGAQVPIVVADLSKIKKITPEHLQGIGYTYHADTDKWMIADTAADYIFTGNQILPFALPGTLKVLVYPATWAEHFMTIADDEISPFSNGDELDALDALNDQRISPFPKGGELSSLTTVNDPGDSPQPEAKYFPIFDASGFVDAEWRSPQMNFVMLDCFSDETSLNDFTHLDAVANDPTVVLCLSSTRSNAMQAVRRMFIELAARSIQNPVVIIVDSDGEATDDHLIKWSTDAGALLLDGFGDGVCFGMTKKRYDELKASYEQTTDNGRQIAEEQTVGGGLSTGSGARTYLQNASPEQFINNTAFSILQATRTRISKTEYISCPSCGRTLFDLQETTAKIRSVTHHLKGVKIAIMGCIVNGPGEMADADFGYVGSGPGKITLYKGKEVVKKGVPSEVAVEELINLLKEAGAWVEPQLIVA